MSRTFKSKILLITLSLFVFAVSQCSKTQVTSTASMPFNPWKVTTKLVGAPHSVACSSNGNCIIGGGTQDGHGRIWFSHKNGVWQTASLPNNLSIIGDVSCAGKVACFAVGTTESESLPAILESNDGGTTWKMQRTWLELAEFKSIFCTTSLHCIAGGNLKQPLVYTTNGGTTWDTSNLPDSVFGTNIKTISCFSNLTCIAAGSSLSKGANALILKSLDGGANWTEVLSSTTASVLNAASCPSSNTCYTVGASLIGGIDGFTVNLSTNLVSNLRLPSGISSSSGIFCTSDSSCWVSGSNSKNQPTFIETTTGGDKWGLFSVGDSVAENGESVVCTPINNECLSVGANSLNEYGQVFSSTLPNSSQNTVLGFVQHQTDSTIGDLITPVTGLHKTFIPNSFNKTLSVLVVGDSTALTLGLGMLDADGLPNIHINVLGLIGCGVVGSGVPRQHGTPYASMPETCTNWQQLYSQEVNTYKPNIVFFLVGRWEEEDRLINGKWTNLNQSSYQQLVLNNLISAIKTLRSTGATVVALTDPANFTGPPPSGSYWPEDQPSKVMEFNKLLAKAVSEVGKNAYLYNFAQIVSPNNTFNKDLNGVPIRTNDGIHYTSIAGPYLNQWLLPVGIHFLLASGSN